MVKYKDLLNEEKYGEYGEYGLKRSEYFYHLVFQAFKLHVIASA